MDHNGKPGADESKIDEMNKIVGVLQDRIGAHLRLRAKCFVPDTKKAGGAYQQHEAQFCRIVEAECRPIFTDGLEIALDDVSQIEIREDDGSQPSFRA